MLATPGNVKIGDDYQLVISKFWKREENKKTFTKFGVYVVLTSQVLWQNISNDRDGIRAFIETA